ncbi:ABC transporter permease [Tissierella sp. MB52-C2]|uniref:ABC transporter permease n=1 Tax=Tissierella sp. MB52-C2 TaxID=3070999 RepID=UPI00280A813D|nr:ABC transporter permease [Tissierella sp. MB52-C2]WMM24907.1 ABC transporter permease [Tissierella sp. MB52-C2]
MKAFRTMFKTELKLAIRGMDMVIFAIVLPVVVMIIIGAIYGDKAAFEGAEYSFLAQSFGGVVTIAISASGMMGLPLVVADYRNKKILKRFKVTPMSPTLILFVQIVVNMLMSFASLLLVYVAGAIFFGLRLKGDWFAFLGSYFLVLLSIYSIGMMVGAVSPNIKTSNLLCCILYFPALIFSGATLPYEVLPTVLQKMADILPLTQGIKLLKATSLGLPIGSVLFPITIMVVISVICVCISVRFFRWE